MKKGYNVAIDGPAGAGKSTIAKRIAKEMNFIYVDTGAMYRAMALYLIRQGIAPEDTDRIAEVCSGADISIEYRDGEQVVLLSGENVNAFLRTEEVGNMASWSSAVPAVREKLVELQQRLAATADVVMDGRDIGTVVLPEADVKIFLTASSEVRARRRWLELEQRGTSREFAQLLRETRERDENDSRRAASPLRPAPDAVALDTTEIDFQESLARIIQIIRERAGL